MAQRPTTKQFSELFHFIKKKSISTVHEHHESLWQDEYKNAAKIWNFLFWPNSKSKDEVIDKTDSTRKIEEAIN